MGLQDINSGLELSKLHFLTLPGRRRRQQQQPGAPTRPIIRSDPPHSDNKAPRGDKSEGFFFDFLIFLGFRLPHFLEKLRFGGRDPGENDF